MKPALFSFRVSVRVFVVISKTRFVEITIIGSRPIENKHPGRHVYLTYILLLGPH